MKTRNRNAQASVGSSAGARAARSLGFGVAISLFPAAQAFAFPLLGSDTETAAPTGTNLGGADVEDLQHHLQLVNGPLVAPQGGWAFQPRVDAQWLLTDNVYQAHSPRQWDFVTYVAPGFTVAGDLPRLQLYFTYQPTLAMHVEAGSLNSLTQQFSGSATATLVDDWAYLDVRAVSGVGSIYGGLGGFGGVGANAVAGTTAASFTGTGATIGLNKDTAVQSSSFLVSPYIQHRLGDYGNFRLGLSFGLTHSASINGFLASPFPTGGDNQQTYISSEEYFHYDTGDALNAFQYSFDASLNQANTLTGNNYYQTVAGVPQVGPSNYTSGNYYLTNRVAYQFNNTIQVFGTLGYENVTYNDQNFQNINGITWSVGTSLTPSPDASLTMSYGYNNGYYQFNMNGYYNVTARTSVNAAYYSSVGTQLQYLQSQLGLATGPNMTNVQNGGQLFTGTTLLAPQQGVFRFDTFSFGAQTNLNRDILSAYVGLSRSTQQGVNAAPPSTGTSFSVQWTHELQDDLLLVAAAAYNTSNQSAALNAINPGNSHAIILSAALQYQLSPTLGATLRYSFFDRVSEVSTNSIYQNMLILGVSKTF
jgi:hypothetical protein